jgi:predicted nuclease of predicted toxin-antitoxin system
MRIVADENIDCGIVKQLEDSGHEVRHFQGKAWSDRPPYSASISDEEVLAIAQTDSAILLTEDKDFGELVFRQRLTTSGVILIRLAGLSSDEKASLTSRLIALHGSEMRGRFTVISPAGIRIREVAP